MLAVRAIETHAPVDRADCSDLLLNAPDSFCSISHRLLPLVGIHAQGPAEIGERLDEIAFALVGKGAIAEAGRHL
jgi:hypothetical protein